MQLEQLKCAHEQICMQKGIDPETIEKLKQKYSYEAVYEFEKFVKDKKREDAKQLCVDAYEGILTINRKDEREILN